MLSAAASFLRKPYLSIALFVLSAPVLVAMQNRSIGWFLIIAGAAAALPLEKLERESMLAICVALAIIAITPINTNLQPLHLLLMSIGMAAAVLVPYLWLERWRGYGIIRYKMRHGRRWYRRELLYVFFPAALCYFVMPFYFRITHNETHWNVLLSPYGLSMLLLGLAAVGIWDELIFVATISSVLRRQLPFWLANMSQAVVFSSFLYSLGFQNWGVVFAYIFALTQCYIFKITNSLLYAITIHVVFDVVLFVVLIHAHYPHLLRIFLVN